MKPYPLPGGLAVGLVVFTLQLLCPVSGFAQFTWEIEVIDPGPQVGQYSSITFDPQHQRLGVSYYDAANQDVKYAAFDGREWQRKIISQDGNVGQYTSFRSDATGRKNLVYYDADRAALQYAGWIGPFWKTTTDIVEKTEGQAQVGQFSTLVLDARQRLMVSYYDLTNRHLQHAYLDKSGWHPTVIDSQVDTGQYSAFVIDAAGRWNIVYYDALTGALKYAGWIDLAPKWGVGKIETIEKPAESQDVGQFSALALNEHGQLCGSYYDVQESQLKFTCFDGDTWQIELLDTFGDIGQYSSFTDDQQGHRNLVFYDATRGALKYAGWLTPFRQAQIEVIEKAEKQHHVGQYSALAVEADNHLCVSYYDLSESQLKYACADTPQWQVTAVDNFGDMGQYSALTVEPNGKPHIVYYDASRQGLRYAGPLKPAWHAELESIEKTTGKEDVGQYSSIAVDSRNQLAISYYDVSDSQLKYTTLEQAAWQSEVVDNLGDVGLYSDLIVLPDSIGITYYDAKKASLNFARKTLR